MRFLKTFVFLCFISVFANFAQADLAELQNTGEIKQLQKPNMNYFNLANIVGNILKNEEAQEPAKDNTKIRQEFIKIASKFNQGNATSAYEEYSELINKLDDDILLLNLAKILYKSGFFTLAHEAEGKIVYKNQYFNNINDLELSYKPKNPLSREDEIFFAKIYSSIFFDNSAKEANTELLAKKEEYQKNDYYNYLLSESYFAQKDYHKALISVNKAVSLNPENVNYKLLKADVLLSLKKYSEALSIVKKLEKNPKIIDLATDIKIKKEFIIAQSTKNDKERKYAVAYKTFLEGNYEKTKKECLYILNFDKDNDKIISLYARAELATGDIEKANAYFINAYKIEKENIDTLTGLGDIRYIHNDYTGAEKMYRRALAKDKTNTEILLKLALIQKENSKKSKELNRTKAKLDKLPKNYLSYYNCAISSAQKNSVLKEDFLKQSLDINPLYVNALGETVALNLKNKNFKNAKELINITSLTLEKNYYYYYLLGLYNQAQNNKQDAIEYYKTSLNLNPNFEIANIRLLKLIPNKSEEI